MKEALTSKILVIGVDGMDPKLTRKYLDEGKMPNVRYLLEHGAARHDLVMLGGHPAYHPAYVDHLGLRLLFQRSRHHRFLPHGQGDRLRLQQLQSQFPKLQSRTFMECFCRGWQKNARFYVARFFLASNFQQSFSPCRRRHDT